MILHSNKDYPFIIFKMKRMLAVPFGVENTWHVNSLVGVGSKIISLCLNEVGRHVLATVCVEIAQRCHQTRHRITHLGSLNDDIPHVLFLGLE